MVPARISILKNKVRQAALCLMFGAGMNLGAQEKPVRFEHLSTRDGLSQNMAMDILQDKQGFIWIATEDGLNRYDGYRFKVFKNIPGNPNSLKDNILFHLYLSADGILWTGGPFGGLGRFNADQQTFTNFLHKIHDSTTIAENAVMSISEDKNCNLWIGTKNKGVDYFNRQTNQFIHMANMLSQSEAFDWSDLKFVHHDSKGLLWVGARDRVFVFKIEMDGELLRPRLIPLPELFTQVKSTFTDIVEDQNSNVWLSTASEGLLFFDRQKSKVIAYRNQELKKALARSEIYTMALDAKNDLWLGCVYPLNGWRMEKNRSSGLIKLHVQTGKIQKYSTNKLDPFSLSSNNIISIFFDRTGVLWAGTFLKGINKYDAQGMKFKLFKTYPDGQKIGPVRSFYLAKNNKLWIATGIGLSCYDRNNGRYRLFKPDSTDDRSISSKVVTSIHDDGRYLWIGTIRGLNRYDPRTDQFKHFYLNPQNKNDVVNNVNYEIIETGHNSNELWYGTGRGLLVRFNKSTHQFKTYHFDAQPDSDGRTLNRENIVRTVFWSPSFPQKIWAGTTFGIFIFDINDNSFRSFKNIPGDSTSLSYSTVMHFYEDERGVVWVATSGGGLNRFDPATQTFTWFTESNSGLQNNTIYGILPDEMGNLWLSSNRGLIRFNSKTQTFRTFSVDDGLQNEEFNGASYHRGYNGELFFGGIEGFNSFFPEEIKDNPYLPDVVITDLNVFEQSFKLKSVPGRQVVGSNPIRLAHWQNDLSFSFVALHFANSSRNQYAIKLENYDQNWKNLGTMRHATYTNLDPGRYIFRVRASNNDGQWNMEGAAVHLIIAPPWWQTYWAYTLYGLIVVMGIIAIDRFQRYRLLTREKGKTALALLEAENQRKSVELEEARNLQLAMLPRTIPQLPQLEIAVFMQTATEVGGDYYDFYLGEDGTLTVAIGDATGHGMRAGTMVTVAKSLFNSHAPHPDILKSFREITRCIKQMHMEKIAMCLTMLKINKTSMQIATAGMPPLLIFRNQSRQVEECLFEAVPLGTMADFPYEMRNLELAAGDCLLLMSDGMPELMNQSEEVYGYPRIKHGFQQVAQKNPREIIDFFRKQGARWVNNRAPKDDVTFIVMKVKT